MNWREHSVRLERHDETLIRTCIEQKQRPNMDGQAAHNSQSAIMKGQAGHYSHSAIMDGQAVMTPSQP